MLVMMSPRVTKSTSSYSYSVSPCLECTPDSTSETAFLLGASQRVCCKAPK
jgi:hypothetical protein